MPPALARARAPRPCTLKPRRGRRIARMYPIEFSVDYPQRQLNRLATAFRIFAAIPILVVIGSIDGWSGSWAGGARTTTVAIGGARPLFLPPPLLFSFPPP